MYKPLYLHQIQAFQRDIIIYTITYSSHLTHQQVIDTLAFYKSQESERNSDFIPLTPDQVFMSIGQQIL